MSLCKDCKNRELDHEEGKYYCTENGIYMDLMGEIKNCNDYQYRGGNL